MTETEKQKKLFQYKALATGLFILMAVIFVATTYLGQSTSSHWVGYVRAFSEAAMVGALADWFAVTALFHYPLGLRIPHTNLIANSKQRIGDNLGSFVVENFLAPDSIRPYIEKLKLSGFLSEWLLKNKNQEALIEEFTQLIKSALSQIKDADMVLFISEKTKEMTQNLEMSKIASGSLIYLIEKGEHEKIISFLSKKIRTYILAHNEVIQDKVSANSYSLVPKFIDKKIADKITASLVEYFSDVENNAHHPLREEISKGIYNFTEELKTSKIWEDKLQDIKDSFLSEHRLNDYAKDIWRAVKLTLLEEIALQDSKLKRYVKQNITRYAQDLNHNAELQHKIDQWIRYNAYRITLKNADKAGELISNTVGNWKEEELSKKLELEVGKDLQFIRINGTLVGGLVGLIIYTIAHFLI